ncbi:MAG: class I mannose-6-phosphate isomerase [Phycisphaerales bacterium]|nr:class I mannose-6-phosphate isomerase [Phycisphaerales bacterium]
MSVYPLRFAPILKAKVWGGDRLGSWGKKLPSDQRIGESWELADLPDSIDGGRSVIANGPLAGRTLREAMVQEGGIMGEASLMEGGFPLLIKFLDAGDNLSVQVHPDEAWVARHPQDHLKSEAWVVLDAKPGALIYRGLADGTTVNSLREAVESGEVPPCLIAIPAVAGDCHYLPSGTCHALGAGVLVAEVQTPSDTTFRVWDWGREGREMHLDQALACIDFTGAAAEASPSPMLKSGPFASTLLTQTPYFSIERIEAVEDAAMPLVMDATPSVLMVLEGEMAIEHEHGFDAPRGTTVLLPAELRAALLQMPSGSVVLRIDLPGPIRLA